LRLIGILVKQTEVYHAYRKIASTSFPATQPQHDCRNGVAISNSLVIGTGIDVYPVEHIREMPMISNGHAYARMSVCVGRVLKV
jgi:hypothetical protein